MLKFTELAKQVKNSMFDYPFFGHLLMKMAKSITKEVDTAAVAIDPDTFNVKLLINPEYWKELSSSQQIGILHHETLHVAFGHLQVMSRFPNRELANIAMDLEINQYIPKTQLHEAWLHLDQEPFKDLQLAPKKGSKFYYDAIEEEMKNNKEFKQKMQGMMGNNGTDHSTWKDYEDMTSQQKKMFDNQQDHNIKETYKDSGEKSMGNLPGGLARRLEKLFEKKPEVFNWKQWFRKFMGTIIDVQRKKTYKRPSKRYPDMPGLKTKKRIKLFVSVDTSGSMGNKEIADVFEQIDYIYKAGAEIYVVTWDTEIHDKFMYAGKPPEAVHGGGGSNIGIAIKEYDKNRKEYTAAIHLTDGWVSNDVPLLGRHLFIITSDGQKFDPGGPHKMFQIPKDVKK